MQSSLDHSITALIPAYNEAAHVAQVVTQSRAYLPVLVVDDGSKDDTAAAAETAGARVLRQIPNQGKGAALRAGFSEAVAHGCAAVLTLDADGQHDPAEIPAFLRAYRERGADLIIGARDFTRMPPVRRLANSIGTLAFSWAAGRPVRDNQSGYRLISLRLMQAMLASGETGFEFEVEMILVAIRSGWPIDWVQIRTIYGDEKSHIQPLKHTLNFARMVWQARLARGSRR